MSIKIKFKSSEIFAGPSGCGTLDRRDIFSAGAASFRHPIAVAVLAVVAGLIAVPAAQAQSRSPPAAFVGGRILVLPRAGLPDAALANILREHGAGNSRRVGQSNLRIVDLPAGEEEATVLRLSRNPHVKFAEVDRYMSIAMTPNDPYFGSEWHLNKINATTSWDIAQGAGVTIAILDTGVDASHPDLAAQIVPGWNFYNNNSDTSDVYGHGTSTAGAAAATMNNGVGVASVSGRSKIMPIRVTDANGYASASTVAQGITYAADKGVRVVSISIDGVASSSATINAANYMRSKGGLVIVAAGNNSRDEGIAATTAMIPVSATDSNDALTSWSSYGKFVAMSAPGLNIYAPKRGGGYWACWGTSFSTPVTAGAVALMMSANPQLANADIEKLLYSTAVDLGAVGRDSVFGYGRVNAGAAVTAASSSTTVSDTQLPSVSIAAPVAGSTATGLVTVDVLATDNVGVNRVELRVNGTAVASDSGAPYAFAWDSTKAANGSATLTAIAYDAAGNSATKSVAVNVSNASSTPPVADSTPPVVGITSPGNGATLKPKGSVNITSSASDNSGLVTQSLYIDGLLRATVSGGALSYGWNVNKVSSGTHTIMVVATDPSKNSSSKTVVVTK